MTTCLLAFLPISLSAADLAGKDELSKPDGQGADMSKPVKVFLIMGQSNAVGLGRIKGDKDSLEKAVTEEKLYPFLVDAASNWTERNDVRNVFALSSVLEPNGAKVEIARNGREALEALARGSAAPADRIDLVLMDIMMPEMDGFTAMREIRRRAEWKPE